MGGYDPYSSSKGCAELLIASYRNSYFPTNDFSNHCPAIATARAGNVIGGGDWAEDRLIPDMIHAFNQMKQRRNKGVRPQNNCCLNRPSDEQSNPRIHLESEAIKIVIDLVEKGTWELLSSDVLDYEISNTSDEKKRRGLQGIKGMAAKTISLTNLIKNRANYFEGFGLQAFDAMHLACAENNSDVLLTVDDRFIKKANKIDGLKVKIKNPLQWLEEVL